MARKYTCRYWLWSLLFVGFPASAEIDPELVRESLVRVRAYDNNRVVTEGTGFVVNDEDHVLTNAHLIEQADQLTVLSLKTGAEILSQQTFVNEDMNLALLHVQGLGLPPLKLSEQGADAGRIVQTLKYATDETVQLSQGAIGVSQDVPGITADDPTVHMLEHNAMISSREFGMPLFNECGQIVAMNAPEPEAVHWLTGRIADAPPYHSHESGSPVKTVSPEGRRFIDHDEISREHTRLTYTNDRLYAEDLDTLNRTRVNGKALQPREKVLLQDQDRLQMGPLILTVRLV